MDVAAILVLLKLLVPGVGAILKQIPVVSNKFIPFILTIFLTIKNWWLLAELPTELIPVAPDPVTGVTMAGFGWLLSNPVTHLVGAVVWGRLDAFIGERFHKSYKYRGIVKNGEAPRWT